MSSAVPTQEERFETKGDHKPEYTSDAGLTEDIVRKISEEKDEPDWMLERRLRAFRAYEQMPMPTGWPGQPDLSGLEIDEIIPYIRPDTEEANDWEDVPEEIKETFDKLGIPEAEKNALSGVGSQFESEVVYQNMKEKWEEKGVIFCNMDTAVQEYPELVKEYFMTKCVPPTDNKFAALHGAVWSGGSFVYVPEGVTVDMPIQAYFRMNTESMGQFEHTLIIAEAGSEVSYIEGCHPAGTEITTVDGRKPVETIEKGDYVITHNGRPREVLETQVREHQGDMLTITPWTQPCKPLELTPEHPLLVSKRGRKGYKNEEWETEWIEAKNVDKHDYLVIPQESFGDKDTLTFAIKEWDRTEQDYKIVEKTFPAEPDFFRLIGYYLAEGSISGGNYLNLSFNAEERDLIDDTCHLIEKYFNKEPVLYEHPTNNGCSVRLSLTSAARVFEHFGSRSGEKEIPNWIFSYSEDCVTEMLKGYFRGDGNFYSATCASGDKTSFRMHTVSRDLAEMVRRLLFSLGVGNSIQKQERDPPRQDMYEVGIHGRDHLKSFSENILNVPWEDTADVTRATKINFNDGKAFIPIREIESESVQTPVYNFKVEEDESYVSEGIAVHNCSAPTYAHHNLHSGGVEVFVGEDANVQYSTIQNWSKNTYNLNTKRAIVEADGHMNWVSGSLGSKVTMLYPSSILKGARSSADHISIAFAGEGQNIDTGAKVYHNAPNTSSNIESKSISKDGGRTNYRGLIHISKNAKNSQTAVECDAMMFDNDSISDTMPFMEILTEQVDVAHEATVGKIGDEDIFYLQSRGLGEAEAKQLIVNGFIETLTEKLPIEYAVEMNRLVELEMEGSLG